MQHTRTKSYIFTNVKLLIFTNASLVKKKIFVLVNILFFDKKIISLREMCLSKVIFHSHKYTLFILKKNKSRL